MSVQTLDPARLNDYVGKMLGDLGAAATASLVITGDRLGLFKALAAEGPLDAAGLAARTATAERYVREWLSAMAASDYVEYDAITRQFRMSPEQIAVFADEDSPCLMTGGFYGIASMFADEPRLTGAFQSGDGIEWGQHDGCLFCGVAKFFRPSYAAHLVNDWIPALDGAQEKLERGIRVADVGCGHGHSTLILAERFPASTFVGYDIHEPSIKHARRLAAEAGLTNVTFEVASAKEFPGQWDLVTFFDCLHDLGDPAGAAAHVRGSLTEGGTWMVVEPMAGDSLEENLNPVGRIYYAFSTAVCTPTSLSQEVGEAIGAQAGPARLGEVIRAGGFGRVRRAADTPFNLVLEARA